MRLFRPGLLQRLIYPKGIFRIPERDKILYLTFDDGPQTGSTDNILDILDRQEVKAIFFCSGSAANSLPDLTEKIASHGHLVGNHGYNHLDGFKTSLKKYCENVKAAEECTSAKIFRPPYGRLTPCQYRVLREKYQLVFWDLMPYDFDRGFSSAMSLDVLKRKMRPGSIIVFHDNRGSTMHLYLEQFINYCFSMGYRFEIPVQLKRYS
jgi:peptidoglycan/xylan/chitin deacetylase (PgdA/CDA1 family)